MFEIREQLLVPVLAIVRDPGLYSGVEELVLRTTAASSLQHGPGDCLDGRGGYVSM